MNGMPTLTTALLDLLKEIEGANVPLIIGGGYGIYLRYMRIVETVLTECGRIIGEQLAGMDTLGTLRLRESAYFRPDFNVTGFLAALKELFPA